MIQASDPRQEDLDNTLRKNTNNASSKRQLDNGLGTILSTWATRHHRGHQRNCQKGFQGPCKPPRPRSQRAPQAPTQANYATWPTAATRANLPVQCWAQLPIKPVSLPSGRGTGGRKGQFPGAVKMPSLDLLLYQNGQDL